MAILKLLLILLTFLAQFYAATPPNVRPPVDQLRGQDPLERVLPHLGWISKIIAATWTALELGLFAHWLPATTPDPTTPTPAFVTGAVLILAGAALRAVCFHTLGPRFTFELAIHPKHALVTGGVYARVRHPSYTGVLALVAGWLLCLADYRTWVVEACAPGRDAVVTAAMACVGVTALGACYAGLSRRMDKEDAMLEETFGDEWRAWAKKVSYRLVPYVC